MTVAAPSRIDLRRATETRVLGLAQGPAMRAAIGELNRGRLSEAERIVRVRLAEVSDDVAALCLLGDIAARAGIHAEAERLFRLALTHAPCFGEAQVNLARLLAMRDGIAEAIAILADVLADLPERSDIALMRLMLLDQVGDYALAAEGYAALLARDPDRPDAWVAKGHLQNTMGDAATCIASYRRAIAIEPDHGEAWWGLANLKTYRFDPDEIGALRAVAGLPDGGSSRRAGLLHFALGKALGDGGDGAGSFAHYARGNAICHAAHGDDGRETSTEVDRSIAFFTRERMMAADGAGHPSDAPIFIVGLPRSGSTLVEQILASHPLVEGTSELPYIPMLVHRLLAECWADPTMRFPNVLATVPKERLRELGQVYLAAAAIHRREGRAHFIDKLPNNWRNVGLIRMILPNARIIDTRREAMACLWSNYRQWFARGQDYSYSFDSLALTWRDYLRLMAHVDTVLPGVVTHVWHEATLDNPEGAIRGMLDRIGLPFDERCLRFYENDRPVRTASAQQVRRPIARGGDDEWRRYEQWLGPLRKRLADGG